MVLQRAAEAEMRQEEERDLPWMCDGNGQTVQSRSLPLSKKPFSGQGKLRATAGQPANRRPPKVMLHSQKEALATMFAGIAR